MPGNGDTGAVKHSELPPRQEDDGHSFTPQYRARCSCGWESSRLFGQHAAAVSLGTHIALAYKRQTLQLNDGS